MEVRALRGVHNKIAPHKRHLSNDCEDKKIIDNFTNTYDDHDILSGGTFRDETLKEEFPELLFYEEQKKKEEERFKYCQPNIILSAEFQHKNGKIQKIQEKTPQIIKENQV